MRFARLAVYRHRNCLDVDILVLKVQYTGPKYTRLRIMYFYRNGTSLNIGDNVKIETAQYLNWRRVG